MFFTSCYVSDLCDNNSDNLLPNSHTVFIGQCESARAHAVPEKCCSVLPHA